MVLKIDYDTVKLQSHLKYVTKTFQYQVPSVAKSWLHPWYSPNSHNKIYNYAVHATFCFQ